MLTRRTRTTEPATGAPVRVLPPPPTEADMRDLGYSEREVVALARLRAVYPFVEYVESSRQWRQVQFVAWRFRGRRADRIDA